MAKRIVVNQFFDDANLITRDKFSLFGEIIVCTEIGREGLYILNEQGEPIRINSQFDGGEDIKEYISNTYITSAQTIDLINSFSASIINEIESIIPTSDWTEEEIANIASAEVAKIVSGAPEAFDTLKEIADWISGDTLSAMSITSAITQTIETVDSLKNIIGEVADDDKTINEKIVELKSEIERLSSTQTTSKKEVVLTQNQYDELINNDKVVVNGILITYDKDTFYYIYEDSEIEENNFTVIVDEENGLIELMGGDVYVDGETIVLPSQLTNNEECINLAL